MFPNMTMNSVSNNALSGAQGAPSEAGAAPSSDGSSQPSDFHGIFNQAGGKPQAAKQKSGDKEAGADQAAAGLIPVPVALPAGNLVPQVLPQILQEAVAGETAGQPDGAEAAKAKAKALLDLILHSNQTATGGGNPALPSTNNAAVRGFKDDVVRTLQPNAGNNPADLSVQIAQINQAGLQPAGPTADAAGGMHIAVNLQQALLNVTEGKGEALLGSLGREAALRGADAGNAAQAMVANLAPATSNYDNNALSTQMRQIDLPVHHHNWSDEVGSRLLWMVKGEVKSAEIRLNPPELGPLEVRISLDSDKQVNVNFTAHHAAVKDLLETSVPKLREMLGESGLNLSNVDISHHSFSQSSHSNSSSNGGSGTNSGQDDDVSQAGVAASVLVSNGLVDYYA